MRIRLVLVAVVGLLSGCGGSPPPDEATSRALVQQVVLDWHRDLAAGDGEAGCALLTEAQQNQMVDFDRNLAKTIGTDGADTCADAVSKTGAISEPGKQVLLNTHVDSIAIHGDRATAVVHSSAVLGGISQPVGEVDIPLRWEDGRWLIDKQSKG
jgi:hypothetical protein